MGPRLVGRGKATARSVCESPGQGFNGAASCGTRKAHQLTFPIVTPSASMGPRLVGRGKEEEEEQPKKYTPLQWGRVLWDAERSLMGRRSFSHLGFNGAASCGTRKAEDGYYLKCLAEASMGPRLVGRGKPILASKTQRRVSPLQWGRVLWDAES